MWPPPSSTYLMEGSKGYHYQSLNNYIKVVQVFWWSRSYFSNELLAWNKSVRKKKQSYVLRLQVSIVALQSRTFLVWIVKKPKTSKTTNGWFWTFIGLTVSHKLKPAWFKLSRNYSSSHFTISFFSQKCDTYPISWSVTLYCKLIIQIKTVFPK